MKRSPFRASVIDHYRSSEELDETLDLVPFPSWPWLALLGGLLIAVLLLVNMNGKSPLTWILSGFVQ